MVQMCVPSRPYLLDPTRKVDSTATFHMFDRSVIEMHHYTFVRRNIRYVQIPCLVALMRPAGG
jgi:hypothetical protein